MSPIPARVRFAVRTRSQGLCERHYPLVEVPAFDMAHRMRRREGGHDPVNITHLCRACHEWSHANPKKAWAEGWIVPANWATITSDDVARIPVQRVNGAWALFLSWDDGRRSAAQPMLPDAAIKRMEWFGLIGGPDAA